MMMEESKLARVMLALMREPWLITPDSHHMLMEIVSAHEAGGALEQAQHALAATMEANPQKRQYAVVDRVAVIPVEGILGRKFSNVLYSSGVTSSDVFSRLVTVAAADEQIDSILLTFDSPGGTAAGTPEAADTVARAGQDKPVMAYVDGLCNSAAYWIASQAQAIYATQSAGVGCIGCYLAILDSFRAEGRPGGVQMFKSGKFKGTGYPGTTLETDERKMLQDNVDRIANEFKAAVRKGRGSINLPDDVMQGQSFSAGEALRVGLIDQIADMDQAMRDARLIGETRKKGRKL
jgi:capsid assembly protease